MSGKFSELTGSCKISIKGGKEIWRDVVGYEGLYKVSNYGRVKSLPRFRKNKGGVLSKLAGGLMKPSPGKRGYMTVNLRKDNKKKLVYVHSLVLEAFVGPRPIGYQACHFPDPNPSNNNQNNLRWDTPKNNYADRYIHRTDPTGSRNPKAVLDKEKACQIRCLYKTGKYSQQQLADRYGVHQTTIGGIVLNKRWLDT